MYKSRLVIQQCIRVSLALCWLLHCAHTAPVNVALDKPITAEITCGTDGAEDYFGLDMEFVLPQNRITQTCENTGMHPPTAMVDGDDGTWWQSMSRNRLLMRDFGTEEDTPDARIVLDLEQSFEVQRITITMGNAKRPARMLLSKSEDGETYTRWSYRVTDAADCTQLFLTPYLTAPSNLGSVVCSTYNEGALQNYEQVVFDFTTLSTNLMAWANTRFLKVEFFGMETTLGLTAIRFHHYAVQSIDVMAECVCNGHNTDCQRANNTGPFQCVCGQFTEGQFCERCLPFYNQQPYEYGEPCVECNCHMHSSECTYDPMLANLSLSLDANGEYVGGGRCLECQHNTTGHNCEKCLPRFYRPSGVAQTDVGACVPCLCNGSGVTISPTSRLHADCVMNDDTPLPDGKVPGDCFCKENADGSKCDSCKTGFFNLTETNPLGCQACLCDVAGTVGGAAAVCDGGAGGQCPCKEFVINRQCDECRDGYYNLDPANDQGCVPCDCDPGGSENDVCDKTDGQCVCRESIGGRRCDGTDSGFYIPDLHFMAGEFEDLQEWSTWDREVPGYKGFGYALATVNGSSSTEILLRSDTQLNGSMYILIRHRSPQQTTAVITITRENGDAVSADVALQQCATWCYTRSDSSVPLSMGQTISVLVTVSADTLLDRAVALPEEFENTESLLGEEATRFHSSCDVINDDIVSVDEVYCMQQILSISAFYLDGAQPCACSAVGSVNADVCQQYGGQCECKPGVTSRACDQCMLEFYGLTSLGCQQCSCATDNKICNFMTGQCVCPEGTFGRTCDSCVANHWNWQSDTGCEYCGCSDIGSLSLQCDVTDGSCTCKPGVGGVKCDTCLDGYTHLSVLGCEDCNCNDEGSTGTVCNVTSGQCPCKANVEGIPCNTCAEGSFYLDASHEFGCLDCVCMGITNACGATTWRTKTLNKALYSGQEGSRVTDFRVASSDGADLGLDVSIVQFNNFPVLEVTIGTDPDVYWTAPGLLSGNMLGLFGNLISFEVYYIRTLSTGTPRDTYVIIRGRDDVSYQLPASQVLGETLTFVEVKVTDAGATRLDGGPVTRGAFLFALSDVRYVMLPASLYSLAHRSRLILVQYQVAMADGLGQVARSVEQCQCGPGYVGLSCEECAEGYRRVNTTDHPYLGLCVTCQCHGHSDTCDPVTGLCLDCLHNTAGDNCDVCEDGYYGDATVGSVSDCTQCPCYAPRVADNNCDVINGSVTCNCATGYAGVLCDQCDVFYFGNPEERGVGSCEPCDCNGNSEQCDAVTGVCLACATNTTGDRCERCRDGWFGDASQQNCQACDCDMAGSTSELCNFTSGQCDCLPGVGNRVCDACLPNYYGYNNSAFQGCSDCMCNEEGSATLQCDEAGVCQCADNTAGDKCDQCDVTFYGLPLQSCQPCACNETGSTNALLPCDAVTGQCECEPGVAGRDCSQCDTFHFNFATSGCSTCGECQYSLGNDTLLVQESWQLYWNESLQVRAIEQEDAYMQSLSAEIERVSRDLGVSSDRLDMLTETVTELEAEELVQNASVTELLSTAEELHGSSIAAFNSSERERERMRSFQQCANNALSNVNALRASALDTISQMTLNNQSANQLLELSRGLDVTSLNVSFESELSRVREESLLVRQTAQDAEAMTEQVGSQLNTSLELERAAYDAQGAFRQLQEPIGEAQGRVTTVQQLLSEVQQHVQTTVQNRAYAESQLDEARTLVAMSETIQAQSQNALDLARQLLDEALDIKEGTQSNLPLPINTTVEYLGTQSWSERLSYVVDDMLPRLNDSVIGYNETIRTREAHARTTQAAASAIYNELLYVEPKGRGAVDAIEKFERVVQVLQDSLALAEQANATIQQAMQVIERVSIEGLKNETANSVMESSANLTHAQAYDDAADGFVAQFDEVNNTLEETIAFWEVLQTDIDSFNSAVDVIHDRAEDETTRNQLNALTDRVATVKEGIDNLAADSHFQAGQAAQAQQDLATLQDKVTNASSILTRIPSELDEFQRRLDNDIQVSVDLASQRDRASSDIQRRIDEKIAQLEEAILQAEERLVTLEQPVSLDSDTYLQMTNPQREETMLFNEIQVDFKLNVELKGVVVLVENTESNEYLLLQVRDAVLVYGFGNVDQEVVVESPVELCPGCWFRVLASRYGTDVKLTVTKLNTGGTATSYGSLESSTHSTLQLNTNLYVGGLPQDQYFRELPMIDYAQSGFDGCIYNLVFDDNPIPLWQSLLARESGGQCCRKPEVASLDPPTIPGTSFTGFGYLKLNYTQLEVHTQSHILIRFRTFSPNAVLFLADQENVNAFYGIYMEDGRLAMYANNGVGGSVVLGTERFYDDGQWYEITALLNSTYAQIYTERDDNGAMTSLGVISEAHSVDMSALEFPHYTIGAQNPSTTNSRGPVSTPFAGCIGRVETSVNSTDPSLVPLPLQQYAEDYAGVGFEQCFEQVIPGIGFREDRGYAELSLTTESVRIVEFDLTTYEMNGLLLYAQLGSSPSSNFLYVALYHGDILVLFDQGLGRQKPLRTRGLHLADGLLHRIRLDFFVHNSPRLSVDGTTHYGALAMSAGMNIGSNHLYVGGIPPSVSLDDSLDPVRKSLIGGIKDLKINLVSVDFLELLARENQQGVYLSGLPAPPESLPPLPYPTTQSPPTTPQPSCGSSGLFTVSERGVRFGDEEMSYIAYESSNIEGLTEMLVSAFAVKIEFRALQPDGLLFYMASANRNPGNYFVLYMQDGYLYASMESGSNSDITKNLRSRESSYNDGEWWTVEALRLNDFMAIIIDGNQDYNNNGGDASAPSTLEVTTLLYVGGVSSAIDAASPFSTGHVGNLGRASFHGCIRRAEIISHDSTYVTLPLGSRDEEDGVSQCFEHVTPGVFINSSNSYVRVEREGSTTFNIQNGSRIDVTFRGNGINGTLLVAYQSETVFFLVDIINGQICIVMGNRDNRQAPLIVKSLSLDAGYSLCSEREHTLYVMLTANALLFDYNARGWEAWSYPSNYPAPVMTGMSLYAGGVKDPEWTFPMPTSRTSFRGCIINLKVSESDYNLAASSDKHAIFAGCPAPLDPDPLTPWA